MKPNLFIIGAMKAGTTSLHYYLDSLASVTMSEPKEINFFSNAKYWNKGFRWYEKHFKCDTPLRGESSTSYTAFPHRPDVPERISTYCPKAKFIYIVREPVSRLVSHFLHHVSQGRENRSFGEVAADVTSDSASPYVTQGMYYFQLCRYLDLFPRDNIHVMTLESLVHSPKQSLAAVCAFLGIDDDFPPNAFSKAHNSNKDVHLQRNPLTNILYPRWMQMHARMPWLIKSPFFRLAKTVSRPVTRPVLDNHLHRRLYELFAEDVRALENVIGHPLSEWELAPLSADERVQVDSFGVT